MAAVQQRGAAMPAEKTTYLLEWTEAKAVAKGTHRQLQVTVTLTAPSSVEVRTATAAGRASAQGPDPHSGSARAQALAALRLCKFEKPEYVIDVYAPDRILDVCYAALHYHKPLKNKAGYVNSALRLGWAVQPGRPQEGEETGGGE